MTFWEILFNVVAIFWSPIVTKGKMKWTPRHFRSHRTLTVSAKNHPRSAARIAAGLQKHTQDVIARAESRVLT